MAKNYHTILSRAVNALSPNAEQARRDLYSSARGTLAKHLRSVSPPWPEAKILAEKFALEAAIARVEAEVGGPNTPQGALFLIKHFGRGSTAKRIRSLRETSTPLRAGIIGAGIFILICGVGIYAYIARVSEPSSTASAGTVATPIKPQVVDAVPKPSLALKGNQADQAQHAQDEMKMISESDLSELLDQSGKPECRAKTGCRVVTNAKSKFLLAPLSTNNSRVLFEVIQSQINGLGTCGTSGCSTAVLEVKNGKFVILKEGSGLTEAEVKKIAGVTDIVGKTEKGLSRQSGAALIIDEDLRLPHGAGCTSELAPQRDQDNVEFASTCVLTERHNVVRWFCKNGLTVEVAAGAEPIKRANICTSDFILSQIGTKTVCFTRVTDTDYFLPRNLQGAYQDQIILNGDTVEADIVISPTLKAAMLLYMRSKMERECQRHLAQQLGAKDSANGTALTAEAPQISVVKVCRSNFEQPCSLFSYAQGKDDKWIDVVDPRLGELNQRQAIAAQIRAQNQQRAIAQARARPVTLSVSGPLSSEVAECVRGFFPAMGAFAPIKNRPCSDYMRVVEIKTSDTRDIPGRTEALTDIIVEAVQPMGGTSMMAGACFGGSANDVPIGGTVRIQTRIQFERENSGLRCTSTSW